MKLEHVALNVPQPREAARWYADNLGLAIVVAREESTRIHFLSDGTGAMIEFYDNPAGERPDYRGMSPYTLHLAFAVDDIAAEHRRLVAAGCEPVGRIETTPAGDLLAFLRDPWGVALQLVRRREPREGAAG